MKANKTQLLVVLLSALLTGAAALSQAQAVERLPAPKLQMKTTTAVPMGPGGLAPIQISCATGFNKTQHSKDNQGATTVLKCETPIIHCPKSPKYAGLIIKPEAVKVGGGFRFSYSCSYFDPPK